MFSLICFVFYYERYSIGSAAVCFNLQGGDIMTRLLLLLFKRALLCLKISCCWVQRLLCEANIVLLVCLQAVTGSAREFAWPQHPIPVLLFLMSSTRRHGEQCVYRVTTGRT